MSRLVYAAAPSTGGAAQRVFLATPVYGTGMCAGYASSMFKTAHALAAAGIDAEFAIEEGNCHVDDARNFLVRRFLESPATDLFFIDADLTWEAADVVRLLGHDCDVVGATYRLKQFGPEIYPVVKDAAEPREDGLMRVNGLPTGFLRIKRKVLEELANASESYPTSKDWPGRPQIPIIFERAIRDGMRWGGDTNFCRKWVDRGGTVWLDPEPGFEHRGEYNWRGSMGTHLRNQRDGAEGVIRDGLEKIRDGREGTHTLFDMVAAWDNGPWAVTEELMVAALQFARNTTGPVLECGSGLSTLLLAAAVGPEREVWALEHNSEWAAKVAAYGLPNVKLWTAPLMDYGDFEWYQTPPNLPEQFGLVVCDGPTRGTRGGRSGLRHLMAERIVPGAGLIFDDADQSYLAELEAWRAIIGAPMHVLGNNRRFAVGRAPTDATFALSTAG